MTEKDLNFTESRVCPKCNRQYPAEVRFCNADGTELVSPEKMIPKCVKCGKVYEDGTKFCPDDGGRIVPEALRKNVIEDLKELNIDKLKEIKLDDLKKPDALKKIALAVAAVAGVIDLFLLLGFFFHDEFNTEVEFVKMLAGISRPDISVMLYMYYLKHYVMGWIIFALVLAGAAKYINAVLLKNENKDGISILADKVIYMAGGVALVFLFLGLIAPSGLWN
jgi:RNA polymerase subunit RPABC4/transcription elongation factor Spt4